MYLQVNLCQLVNSDLSFRLLRNKTSKFQFNKIKNQKYKQL